MSYESTCVIVSPDNLEHLRHISLTPSHTCISHSTCGASCYSGE